MLRSTPACQQREPSGETNTNHHDTQSNCRTRGCEAMRLYSKLCQELAARTTSEPHRNRCLQSRWVTWPRHSRGQEAKHQCDRRRHIIWMICRNERIEPPCPSARAARPRPRFLPVELVTALDGAATGRKLASSGRRCCEQLHNPTGFLQYL